MSVARYLSKLGLMLGSDGKVPAAGLATGAAGVLPWVALGNSAGSSPWVKLCTINGSQNDRGTILLSGSYGYSAADDLVAGGATIHYTIGNVSSTNNLNCHVINSSSNPFILAAYAVRITDYQWDLWVQANVYERINCLAYGNIYTITNTYTDFTQAAKPTGGYDKKVGRAVTSLTPGAVLQVVQAVKSDTWVNTVGDTYTEVSGLIASITPSSATSKILVSVNLGSVSMYSASIRFLRNGSAISGAMGQTAGSRPAMTARASYLDGNHPTDLAMTYLDSPGSASAVTYSIGATGYGGYPFYLNRSQNDTDTSNAYGGRTISTITLMEIAA